MGRVNDPTPRDLEMASALSVGPSVNSRRIRTLTRITKMKFKWTRRWRRKVLGAAEEGVALVVVVEEGVDVVAEALVAVAEDAAAAAAAAVVAAAAEVLRAEWVRRMKKDRFFLVCFTLAFFFSARIWILFLCLLFVRFVRFLIVSPSLFLMETP